MKSFPGKIALIVFVAGIADFAMAAQKYAVCVGLNHYRYASSLSGCVNDALYFYTNLAVRGGWPASKMTKLTDGAATKTAIRRAIADCAARAVSGDTFVFMQSSHGGCNSGYSVFLCAYDGDYEDTELAADLGNFRSGVKVVVVVDACHSGGLFKRNGTGGFCLAERVSAIMDQTRANRLARGENGVEAKLSSSEIGWVTAADYDEYSYDGGSYGDGWNDIPGGVFLCAFTEGWWNGGADRTGAGDNDGYMDGYEGWYYAKARCSGFSPQYYNANVLRSVELGVSGDNPHPDPDPVMLATAVDNTSLSFTTGGDASWSGQTATSYDGVDAAQSGAIGDWEETWMQTTVTGSGTVSFWWKVSSEEGCDCLEFLVDGVQKSAISGTGANWTRETVVVSGSGSHTLKWLYRKDGSVSSGSDCGWVDQVVWSQSSPTPSTLATAVDNTSLSFTTGGDASWSGQTATTCDGVDAAQSGAIGDWEETWMQATGASGAGIVSFRWKVSSEEDWDWIEFYVDGTRKARWSGTGSGWRHEAFKVGSGTHVFRWVYSKDGSWSSGSDRAWVDKVKWTPGSPLVPVYRFYSPECKGHFFTRSESEMTDLVESGSHWGYEGVAYFAYPSQVSGTTPLYRFYSQKYRGHFYTRSYDEYSRLRNRNRNWQYERIACYVRSASQSGATPVYRFCSRRYGHHFYTASRSEYLSLRNSNSNWKYETIAFYAWTEPDNLRASAAFAGTDAVEGGGDGVASAPGVRAMPGAGELSGPKREGTKCGPVAASPSGIPWTLTALPENGYPLSVAECGETEVGTLALEVCPEAPAVEELADAAGGDAIHPVALNLTLPDGVWEASLWSVHDGTLFSKEVEGSLDFEIGIQGVWHWLAIRNAEGKTVRSLWFLAE